MNQKILTNVFISIFDEVCAELHAVEQTVGLIGEVHVDATEHFDPRRGIFDIASTMKAYLVIRTIYRNERDYYCKEIQEIVDPYVVDPEETDLYIHLLNYGYRFNGKMDEEGGPEVEIVYVREPLESIPDSTTPKRAIRSTPKEAQEVHERDDIESKSSSADGIAKKDLPNAEVSNDKEDYSSVTMKWREHFIKYKSERIKTFIPIRKLAEEEVNMLAAELLNCGFIDKATAPERLAHILSGEEYDGGEPVIWIKSQKKNHKPSKVSVLNFLHLLGVKKDTIIPKRLNCCFLCSDTNLFRAFKQNNIFSSMVSEYNEDLETIIRSIFPKGDAIIRLMEN